jgi:ABC-type uncharacterized transport system permease subunit
MKWWQYIGFFFVGWAGLGFVIAASLFTAKELPKPISFIGGIFFWTFLPALLLAGITFATGYLTEFIQRYLRSKKNREKSGDAISGK